MPLPERATPGWSAAYLSSGFTRARAVARQPRRFTAERVYPAWSLAYPPTSPSGARPAAVSSDPAERLLRQVSASLLVVCATKPLAHHSTRRCVS